MSAGQQFGIDTADAKDAIDIAAFIRNEGAQTGRRRGQNATVAGGVANALKASAAEMSDCMGTSQGSRG